MSSVTARDALEYATRDEWLKLYALLIGSWVLTLAAPLFDLFGIVLALVGGGVFVVVVVAGAHKLLVESRDPGAGGL